VTDQSSHTPTLSDSLQKPATIVPAKGGCNPAPPNSERPFRPACLICGRPGRWTDPFFAIGVKNDPARNRNSDP
jgi:hypothetical protein